MREQPTPDLDSALVLGMASTAIPFAASREQEAERWLRILRLHGDAGAALQALGVSEAPLEVQGAHDSEATGPTGSEDVLERIVDVATTAAARRQAPCFTTIDVLTAVIDVYGNDFDYVLRAHGTDRQEVLERLHPLAA